ncbi:CoA-binding protein [Breznakiella homolactica]|uniref:CoA-binding protein n=1 Tax=Breznakiella homolactica TaxID=2798577 RepID=A0A7T7XRM8_9SPIR|nr:CoA-binding protein [Breznakiella homolactica]QQO11182.1 CoA-binding protein [Breznakiella homolactica]
MKKNNVRTVAVLGASGNPERYAYKAVERLKGDGYTVYPVHPELVSVLGISAVPDLSKIPVPLDTVTVYLSAKRSTPLIPDIIRVKPSRVILNPGAENPELEKALDASGIPWLHACTLVLLGTGQF